MDYIVVPATRSDWLKMRRLAPTMDQCRELVAEEVADQVRAMRAVNEAFCVAEETTDDAA